jgi:serine/threonine protein phosphatase PrpC
MIRDDLLKNKNSTKLVEDLLDHLLARDTSEGLGCDNMTAILITLK